MNKSELEENLEKMNHSTLVSAYIQLMDKLRMAEGQLDNKEKLLKGYQMKLEENEEQKNLLAFDLNEVRSHLRKQETLLNNSREDDFGFYDKCRYQTVGCKFEVPKIIYHERNECQFRPLRCPSLTCEETPSLHGLWKHINELHDGNTKGKDKICHNDTNHLVSSYVNIDNEPIFYKKNKMSWVTNEMQYDGKRFFLECMRIPPNWHLWVYFIGSTVEASRYAATIALFREEEYKRLSSENGLTSQRSFTGPVIPIHISKDEIGEKGLGFMVHDNQIKPLCGRLNNSHEEQLFGYEVTEERGRAWKSVEDSGDSNDTLGVGGRRREKRRGRRGLTSHSLFREINGIYFPLLILPFALGISYTNEFAVQVRGGSHEAHRLAQELDCINRGHLFDDIYRFTHTRIRKRSIQIHSNFHSLLTNHSRIHWWEQQRVLSRKKRQIWAMPAPPQESQYPRGDLIDLARLNDERWNQMWYLNRGGKVDMNVQKAWEFGATGKGVHVTILDDGVERSHPDLRQNFDPMSSFDVNDNDDDPTPRYDISDSNKHGTRCAGEVAATANNSICGVGVAYEAGIGGLRMLDGDVTDAVEAHSLLFHNQHIDIYSASWGPDDDGLTVDGPGTLAQKAFMKGIAEGRGGKGSIFVWASGNGGRHHDNCNCDGYTNSIWTLSVSSASENGLSPWYSEACSSSLVSTYSSGSPGERKIVTTDLHHGCTSSHTGTSASAPLAAGIKANLRAKDWDTNAVGRNFSHSFGYGIMDTHCMVKLAKNWVSVPTQLQADIAGDRRVDVSIHGKSKATSTMNVKDTRGIKYLEHVQVHVTISAARRGDIIIYIISPSGTRSKLLARRPKDYSQMGFNDWPFLTVHFWEESPFGTWTLEVSNDGRSMVQLRRWSLTLYGTSGHPQQSLTESTIKVSSTVASVDIPEKLKPSSNDSSNGKNPQVYLNNCVEIDPQVALGWCSSCEEGFILHNGRCEKTCPQSYYAGVSNMKPTCVPCYYSCKTCSGPNDYECTSCFGDAKFMKESNNLKYSVLIPRANPSTLLSK
ncbi:FURIN [Lepeophtheirus salmonis]|uniref:furin n=1 Tax=Lepeophtheirus salmonis TaxID=72036 RepID=A0A7R8HB52_LEPSM|nr:FURIN [Lepeophtheirus salmonis]CAF2986729.1 FURIN [Lepeophtheirus salmonis]